jgi:hypothetical protein
VVAVKAHDSRFWARFTLDFADSPKIACLSDSAFRTLVEMILYSQRLLTDGVIRADVARKRWPSESLTELLSNDSANPSLLERDGDLIIHDFLDHQESREEIESRKRRNQANGRRGGLAKSKRKASESISESPSENVADIDRDIDIYKPPVVPLEGDTTEKDDSSSKPSKSRTSKTLIPDGWHPSEHHVKVASEKHIDLATEAEKFKAYAESNARRYANWDQAFNNWLLNASNFNRSQHGYMNKAQQRYEQNMQRVRNAQIAERSKQPQLTGGSDNAFGF